MSNLLNSTHEYIRAFGARDLTATAALLHDDFVLEDPAGRFEGKERVLEYIRGIFEAATSLDFRAVNVFVDGETSIIEFVLEISGAHLTGVDIIEWEGGKLKALRAYLYQKTAGQ